MEDSLVLFSGICVSGFNMRVNCKLVCVVVLHVIRHGTREKNQSFHVHHVQTQNQKPTNQTFVEDSLVLFRVVCVSGFHTCDICRRVFVVVLQVITHGTREKNQFNPGSHAIFYSENQTAELRQSTNCRNQRNRAQQRILMFLVSGNTRHQE